MTTYTQYTGRALLIVASLAGFGISLYHYLAPMTGVTGTAGALLVVVTSLLITLGGVALFFIPTGIFAGTIRFLVLLGVLGTLTAAWFLHEFWLVAATVVALLGVCIDVASVRGKHK